MEAGKVKVLVVEYEKLKEGQKEDKKTKEKDSSRNGVKKSKKKEKKKKEKGSIEGDGEKSSPVEKKEKKKVGGKARTKKSLNVIYTGTSMNPLYKIRKRLAKMVRKGLKKIKEMSSDYSSHATGSESEDEVEFEVLANRGKIARIASMAPGMLNALTLEHMKPHVGQVAGNGWEVDDKSLPPVIRLYHRMYLAPRLSGGPGREVTTLNWVADLLVQGRVAEGLDGIFQRLKSLELVAQGTPWAQTQKLELAPNHKPTMGSRAEYQEAQGKQG